jgi:hypothetical protein
MEGSFAAIETSATIGLEEDICSSENKIKSKV